MYRLSTVISALILSACSLWPETYVMEIQQGNVLTQPQVQEITPGMSKQQVIAVLGEPLLSDLSSDRWDYIHYRIVDGQKTEDQRLTLFFHDDNLGRMITNMHE